MNNVQLKHFCYLYKNVCTAQTFLFELYIVVTFLKLQTRLIGMYVLIYKLQLHI